MIKGRKKLLNMVLILMALGAFQGVFLPTEARSRTSITQTPSTFSEYVVDLANREFPDLEIEQTDSPLSLKMKNDGSLSLENLYKHVRNYRSRALIRKEIRRFLSVINNMPPTAQKVKTWDEVKERLRPQIFPKEYLQESWMKENMVFKPLPFTKDLMEGFVIDSDKAFQYVQKKHLKTWGVTIEKIKSTAYENLNTATAKTRLRPMRARGKRAKGKFIEIAVNDGYAAARLLLPNFRNQIENRLGKPCYVAIPNRDFLVAWSYDFSQDEKFQRQVVREFHFRDHPLSPEIYAIVNSQIEKKKEIEPKDKDEDSKESDSEKSSL